LHELALALGGITVGELRERMTFAEFSNWLAFERIYGPVNPLLRLDAAVARAVAPFLKRDARVREYLMPWPKEPVEEESPASVEQVMQLLSAVRRGSKH
jgi:hypothetical protein